MTIVEFGGKHIYSNRFRIIRIERLSASKFGGDNWLSLVGLAIAGLGSRLVNVACGAAPAQTRS